MANRSNINLVGNTTTGQNLGTGAGIFKCKNNGNNLQFKTISATGTSIQIFNCDNQIYISGSTGGGDSFWCRDGVNNLIYPKTSGDDIRLDSNAFINWLGTDACISAINSGASTWLCLKRGGSCVGLGPTGSISLDSCSSNVSIPRLASRTTETNVVYIGAGGRLLSGATSGGTGGSGIGWSDLTNGSTVAGCGTVANIATICNNTYYGVSAGASTTTGQNNTAIGHNSLSNNILGCGNVVVGFNAGAGETGSNKLHIGNNAESSLIYGEFDNKLIQVNGQLAVTGITQSDGSGICALVWESGTTLVKKLPIINEWVDSEVGLSYTGQKYSYPTHSIFETDVDTCIQVPNYILKKNINLKNVGDTLIFTIPADKIALLNHAKLVFLCDAPTTRFCVSIGTNYCANPALGFNNLVSCLAIDNITQYCTYSLTPLQQAVAGNVADNVYFRVGSGTCDGCELCAHLIFEGFIF